MTAFKIARRLPLAMVIGAGLIWAETAMAQARHHADRRPPPATVRGWAPQRAWPAEPGPRPGVITATTPNASGNFGGPGAGGGGGGGP